MTRWASGTRAAPVAAAALVLLAVAGYGTLRLGTPNQVGWPLLAAVLGLFLPYLAGCAAVRRAPVRTGTVLAVAGGALLQAVAVAVPPRMTDDYLRYAWDGRVQAAGVDPYRYPPGAPELAGLRDRWLFPDGVTPVLNHPGDRTIYPPVAQAWFWLVHVLSGGHGRALPLQVGAGVLAVLTSVAIVAVLARSGGDPRRVVWWAWCPVVVLEAGNDAHVDVLAALLTVLALGATAARRWAAAGALLGLAVATKMLPALAAVAVPPRRWWRAGAAAVAAVVLVYLPHVRVLGGDVLGFLPGYLTEEAGGRFRVLRAVLPDAVVPAVATVLLAGTALLAWRASAREGDSAAAPVPVPPRPWRAAAVMVGVSFLVLTPSYPWYALLLVALVGLGGRPAWLWVAAAGYPPYFSAPLGLPNGPTRAACYGAAALAVAGCYLVGRRRAALRSTPGPDRSPGGPARMPARPGRPSPARRRPGRTTP